MKWLNKKLGYEYDHSKRMWYRYRSKCHNSLTQQKTVFKGRILKVPFTSLSKEDKKLVTFPDYCNYCYKPCKLIWKFKHD